LFTELTIRSFRERIVHPAVLCLRATQIKRQCEKEAGVRSRARAIADNWLLLSLVALASFWYLVGWYYALLLAAAVLLHEAGHALAMRIAGIEVHAIYLVPFFGGAAMPKSSYRSESNHAFVALMGPAFSLVPTLALAATAHASGHPRPFMEATWLFAILNATNLLPIYPLDGGLVLNALAGSISPRLARATGWIGLLIGLGAAVYWHSLLIGIPFLLFALQRYLGGGRMLALQRLSLVGGAAVVIGYLATVAVYLRVLTS
jgi:Zn-dependent protease